MVTTRYCEQGCGYKLPAEYADNETTCGACLNELYNEITKGDIWGIIDYLQDGLGNYINNPGGRPYDDDEIININEWVQRCCVWLNKQIKEMP